MVARGIDSHICKMSARITIAIVSTLCSRQEVVAVVCSDTCASHSTHFLLVCPSVYSLCTHSMAGPPVLAVGSALVAL